MYKRQVIEILPDDERLAEGRIVLEPQSVKNGIAAESIERAQGTPSYYGTLEIRKEPEGLLLINELDIEDYLTRVVPSEMPSYYEKEALKAQAVCARTYAYRQIQACLLYTSRCPRRWRLWTQPGRWRR